jgi:AMMECR1 domain-containing protein
MIESVIRQAISSAADDVRFPSVTSEELPGLSIRISALSHLRRIEPEEIILGRHGLLIIQGRCSGLLLPEVPRLFGLKTRAQFLSALYRKARITTEPDLGADFELYAFETEAWGDAD